MKTSTTAINSALAAVLAIGCAAAFEASAAADPSMEKCAGIVKGGANDCATSTNACHGHVSGDANPEAWIYLPKGSCNKIVGGRITQQEAPDEKSSSAIPFQQLFPSI